MKSRARTIQGVPETRHRRFAVALVAVTAVLTLAAPPRVASAGRASTGGAWPGYRYDNARSGYCPEPVAVPLALEWVYVPKHAPRPAWPEPGRELHRMPFDYAFHVAVAEGLVFFGSSADHKVYALDLGTGAERWSFFTEGPIRFAPAVSQGKLYVAGDDGLLYCLEAQTGRLLWKFRGGPGDRRLIGNEQMISHWPARAGVALDGKTAYFTAGMWARDGIYVYALDAEDGSVIWKNDTSGYHYIPIPHHEGTSGVAPQGQLLVYEDSLIVPTGRAAPAIFDRNTGELLFYRTDWSKTHHPGSSWVIAGKGLVLFERRVRGLDYHVRLGEDEPAPGEGLLAIDCRTGEGRFALTDKHRAVIAGDNMYLTGAGYIVAVNLNDILQVAPEYIGTGKIDPVLRAKEKAARDPDIARIRGENVRLSASTGSPWHQSVVGLMATEPFEKWATPVGRTYSLIRVGNTLVAGGRGVVTAFDADTGKKLWSSEVSGSVYGLAAASGRLIASTSDGRLYCFGAGTSGEPIVVAPESRTPAISRESQRKAARILDESGITAGYCLMLGAGDGELAAALAVRSDLVIYCIEPDATKAQTARRMLDSAGLYGVRVAVHVGVLEPLPYADYFANLIVIDESVAGPATASSGREIYRVLRPYGGVACVRTQASSTTALEKWLRDAGVPADEISVARDGLRVVRGPLAGAGEWTHEYADAGRSGASSETLVHLPLQMLWFGGVGPARIVSRHWRGPVPLFTNGRMFIPGEHHVIAIDAYNGWELWSRELPDVGRYRVFRGGNIVADDEHVYALQGIECLQLDAASGRTVRTYRAPFDEDYLDEMHEKLTPEEAIATGFGGANRIEPSPIVWEYLAVADRFVLGTIGVPHATNGWWPEAHPESKHLFAFDKSTGELQWVYDAEEALAPYAVVASAGRVYLIDRTSEAEASRRKRRGRSDGVASALKVLDLATGELVWQKRDVDKRWCMLSISQDILLASGGGRWQGASRGMEAFSASDGKSLWVVDAQAGPMFPVIVGDTLYATAPYHGPVAYEFRTGERKESVNPFTDDEEPYDFRALMSCGIYSGCPNLLLFRSGSSAVYDTARESGVEWYPNTRPSCWINMIPAGGMVLQPEGSSTCTCPYNFQTSHAMVPARINENWPLYFAPLGIRGQAGRRIRHLKLNIGAPGDRRDDEGGLWMGYPRPYQPAVMFLPVETDGRVEYYRRNADDVKIARTDTPWLYAGGARGPMKIRIGLGLNPPAVALPTSAPPEIDGTLDDACWDGSRPLRFVTDKQAVEPRAVAYLRSDDENLYVAFERTASLKDGKPVPWTARAAAAKKALRHDDGLGIRLFSAGNRGVVVYIPALGEASTLDLSRRRGKKIGAWDIAVQTRPMLWTAEAAFPWKLLDQYDVKKSMLMVYLENHNQTGIGPAEVHFQYCPWRTGGFFNHYHTPVVFAAPETPEERTYRLCLHFAESDDVKVGERVFDVKVQGKTVIRGLDVAKEAGGTNTALTREITGITARDAITLELVPAGGETPAGKPPILNAVSVEEEPAGSRALVEHGRD